jgi:hypothetical protein
LPLYSLLYLSRALVRGDAADAAVAEIVRVSRERNRRLDVTGALLFSGGHFAQILEGGKAGVDELMRSILRDPRHCAIAVVQQGEAAARRFPDWSLAYAGRSTFVDRELEGALGAGPAAAPGRAGRILTMLTEFADG